MPVHSGDTIQTLLDRMNLNLPVIVALNDLYEADPHLELTDGDRVDIFPVSGGG